MPMRRTWYGIAWVMLLAACQPNEQASPLVRKHDAAVAIMHERPDAALPALKEACEAGIAQGCANVAWLMINKHMADAQTAIAYYERSCELGSKAGCNNLANLYVEGILAPHDDAKAFHYIRKACDLGHGTACYRAGYITLVGKLTELDMEKVRAYYQRSCNFGDTTGCYDLGYLYLDVHRTKVKRQPEKAYGLFEYGCTEQRFMKACTTQGYLLQHGDGVAKDTEAAKELYRKACSEDEAFACNNLASMFEDGSAGVVDKPLAQRFFGKACQLSSEFCEEVTKP